MKRHLGAYVAVTVGMIASVGFTQERASTREVPAPIQQNESLNQDQTLNQEVIDAVKAIRSQLGGGVVEQWKGLSFDESTRKDAEQEFERELNRLANQANVDPRAQPGSVVSALPWQVPSKSLGKPTPKPPTQSTFPNNSPRPKFSPHARPVMPISPTSRVLRSHHPALHPNSTALLRGAARRLDAMAADLESAELYAEADEIREQARKFWLKARRSNRSSN